MERKYNKNLVEYAASLRKNMTKEEKHLWYDFLRCHPIRFSRQKILGYYIADFYCANAKLVIELDGSQHYEKENLKKDICRTFYLEGFDILVLRFTNFELNNNFNGVCEHIDKIVQQRIEVLKN